jgi:hypothetical protein
MWGLLCQRLVVIALMFATWTDSSTQGLWVLFLVEDIDILLSIVPSANHRKMAFPFPFPIIFPRDVQKSGSGLRKSKGWKASSLPHEKLMRSLVTFPFSAFLFSLFHATNHAS